MVDFWIGSRPGEQEGGSTDPLELFRTVFPGEVLEIYERLRVLAPTIFTRTIDSGKGAEFPAIGGATARYFTPGERLTGQGQIPHGQNLVNVDYPLISDIFLHDFDDAMIHYEVRARYARAMGIALANRDDSDTGIVIAKAARLSSGLVSSYAGGTVLSKTNIDTDGTVMADAIFDAGIEFDTKDNMVMGRRCALRPVQYGLVVKSGKATDHDTSGMGIENGGYATGKVKMINEIPIMKSNNVPSTNITVNPTGARNDYTGDFSKTFGLVYGDEAAACVRRWELEMQQEGTVAGQGDLIVGRMMHGKAPHRADCAIELVKP